MKHLKKAFCLLLAAVMLLALGVPVMAAGEIPVDAEHFPDAALRTYVTDYCDTNKDNKLSAAECAAVQCIDLFEMQITKVADMTGIEHFTNLRELLACNNQITTLDLSGMTKLEKLDVSGCDKLQSLKLAGCTALTAIDYSGTEAEWAQLTKGENALPEGVTVNFNAPIHHYGSWTGTDPNCTTEGQRTRTDRDAQARNRDLLDMQGLVSRFEQKKLSADMEEKQILDKLWDNYELSRTAAEALRQPVHGLRGLDPFGHHAHG